MKRKRGNRRDIKEKEIQEEKQGVLEKNRETEEKRQERETELNYSIIKTSLNLITTEIVVSYL